MKELNGIWWTINKKQIPGTLIINDDNKIVLTTYEQRDGPFEQRDGPFVHFL